MVVIRMHAYAAAIRVAPEGRNGCRIEVEREGEVLEVAMTDDELRQLVAQANQHLDRRAAERTLAMLEAERERRCRAERPEALAVVAELRTRHLERRDVKKATASVGAPAVAVNR